MANPLNITVMRVQNLNTKEITYGYIAKDGYACVADIDFETLEEFLRVFPKKETLIRHVLENQDMAGAAFIVDGEVKLGAVSAINVVGYDDIAQWLSN